MSSIAISPCRPSVRKVKGTGIRTTSVDNQYIRQVTIHIQSLGCRINWLFGDLADGSAVSIMHDGSESKVCSNAVLIALKLLDVHCAPARRIGARMHDGVT